jgi:hypothetical protein
VAGLSYVVSLVNQMSGPAKQASASVSKLATDLQHAKNELAQFQRLKVGAKEFGSSGDFLRYSDMARQAREKVYGLQQAEASLKPATDSATSSMHALTVELGMAAKVVAAVDIAMITLASTAVYLGTRLLRTADDEQTFERQTRAVFTSLAGGDEAGRGMADMLDGLSRRLPVAREKLADWTKELMAAGVSQRDVLYSANKALAGADATTPGGGEKLLAIIERVQAATLTTSGNLKLSNRQLRSLAESGTNVEDVAKKMRVPVAQLIDDLAKGRVNAGQFGTALLEAANEKGRGPLEAMFYALGKLEDKAELFAGQLFKNVNLKPFLEPADRFVHLLDQGTTSGKALEHNVTGGVNLIAKAFGLLVDGINVTILQAETFATKFETFSLRAQLALRPLEKRIEKMFGPDSLLGKAKNLLLYGDTKGEPALTQAAAAAPTTTKAASGYESGAEALSKARLSGSLKGGALQEAADSLGEALANGVRQGLITPEEDIRLQGIALGQGAIAGLKAGVAAATESHSPSRAAERVGRQCGRNVGDGAIGGMRETMYASARATGTADRAAPSASRQSGGGGRHVKIDRVEVNLSGAQMPGDGNEITAHGLAIALERQMLMAGG